MLSEDMPLPAPEDLEAAYCLAGPRQFKCRLHDVFMILSDNHFKKPKGDAMPSLSEPFVLPQGAASLKSSDPQPSDLSKNNKPKGSSGCMTVEGIHKLSRTEE